MYYVFCILLVFVYHDVLCLWVFATHLLGETHIAPIDKTHDRNYTHHQNHHHHYTHPFYTHITDATNSSAQTARRLVETLSNSNDPKIQRSKFLQFMSKMSQGEVVFDANTPGGVRSAQAQEGEGVRVEGGGVLSGGGGGHVGGGTNAAWVGGGDVGVIWVWG